MDRRLSSYTGCLLGLAAGDAMGYAVDNKSLEQIRQHYGPEGLLGYDLANGYADVTSHTQIAAFVCNGLLLGMTRGQMTGAMAPFVRYIALGMRDWAKSQRYRRDPADPIHCWVAKSAPISARRCMDTLMLDTANRGEFGTMDGRAYNRYQTPGAVTAAVAVGLFFDPDRAPRTEIDRLGAEAIAMTHGNPLAYLPGAALAHIISGLSWDGRTDLKELVAEAIDTLEQSYSKDYIQTAEVCRRLRLAVELAADHDVSRTDAMERLECDSVMGVVAGGIYAALCHSTNFDEAMITAVNHSGASAAVGAIAGAILGSLLGVEGLPEFYLECLEPAEVLTELATDMHQGCPMEKDDIFYDTEWDRKYLHGGKG